MGRGGQRGGYLGLADSECESWMMAGCDAPKSGSVAESLERVPTSC